MYWGKKIKKSNLKIKKKISLEDQNAKYNIWLEFISAERMLSYQLENGLPCSKVTFAGCRLNCLAKSRNA